MPHLRVRAPRAGFVLLLLPVFLGSASGAPAPAPADPPAQPAAVSALDARPSVATVIPCITGTCDVRIPTPPVEPQPARPLATGTTPAPRNLAQR